MTMVMITAIAIVKETERGTWFDVRLPPATLRGWTTSVSVRAMQDLSRQRRGTHRAPPPPVPRHTSRAETPPRGSPGQGVGSLPSRGARGQSVIDLVYDAQVVEFFSPHAAGKDAIFVTALGRSRSAVRSSDPAIIPVTSRLRRS